MALALVEVAVVAIEHRVPTLLVLAASALVSVSTPAMAEDKISYQTYKYAESGDRMKVFAADLSIEQSFGTDHALSLDIGHDAISGATPCWKAKAGYANEYTSGLCKVADEVRNSIAGSWLMRDADRNEYTFGAALSREPDFESRELSGQVMLWSDEAHNRAYVFGLALQSNTAIATANTNNTTDKASSAVNLQVGVNQVLDRSSTVELAVFAARDEGYLSNHYLKIVRTSDAGLHYLADDERPQERKAGGLSARWIKSWSPDFKTNLWLRGYTDDWGVKGATVEAKAHWDVTEAWRVSPVLRLNKQGAADFYRSFEGQGNVFAATGLGSNDERLGALETTTVQLNAEYRASKQWAFNAGLVHYQQNTGLKANWATVGFALKY